MWAELCLCSTHTPTMEQHRDEVVWSQAHRHGQVQRRVPLLSAGTCIGPIGQQHHDTVKAVAHDRHMQGRVPGGACAVHVAAPLQQHPGHLEIQTRWALRTQLP